MSDGRHRRDDGVVELHIRVDAVTRGILTSWVVVLVAVTIMLVAARPSGWVAGAVIVACAWAATAIGLVDLRRSALLIDCERRRVGVRGWSPAGKWWTDIDRVVDQSRVTDTPVRGTPVDYWILWATEGGMSRSASRGPRLHVKTIAHMKEREGQGLRPFTITLTSLGDDGAAIAKTLIGGMVPGLAWS